MKPRAYYNDCEHDAAEWLRELIKHKKIADGDVDERSICDVQASELRQYTQVHLFAGIGGWSAALRLARWPDDRRVWTGSCPCPPFSSAGKKKRCPACQGKPIPHPRKTGVFACVSCGHEWKADARHLWPEFQRLIRHAQGDRRQQRRTEPSGGSVVGGCGDGGLGVLTSARVDDKTVMVRAETMTGFVQYEPSSCVDP